MGKNNTELLSIAEKYLGQGGSVFRKYCGLPAGAAYCNAYVSYIFHEGDDSSLYCDGKKETYCPHSIKWCYDNLALIPMYLALPMDVLYFDWERNGVPNHIGFARKRKSCKEIYTIEGNTSGGIVANKTRTAKYVQAVFRPHFAAKFDTSKALVIDGYFGYNSIALLQVVLKKYGTYSGAVDGILGKGTVKGIQKLVKVEADGMWGPGTSKALQKFLGVKADSYFGPDSVKNLQAWINKSAGYDGSTPTPVAPSVPTTTPKADKYKVIDVSVWQGTIDWAKVKADGVVGAIIRYADGKTLDSKFDYNMKQAKANGLHIGAYIFSRAKNKAEAEAEATRLYTACKPYAPDLPLYIDLEASTLSKYADTVAPAFLNKMKMLGGRGGVYANLTWWNKYLTGTAKAYSASPFWIAQYYDKVTYKNPDLFGMWQYSSSGSVKGINGKVDMDWLYIPYWEKTPTPTPSGRYDGEFPSLKLVKSTDQVIADALTFARWITSDNRFGYGRKGGKQYKGTTEYNITHSGGCHFCGSNATKISKAKKAGLSNPEEWEYTYVCNTLVHACYAHAGVPSMLSAKGHSWWTGSYQRSSFWTEIKKPAKITDLKPGDVLGADATHYALYIGNGKIAEATSNGNAAASKEKWASSIHITGSGFFKSVDHVFRLTKPVNTTALIKYGEVSYRVKLVQNFLNWFYNKNVCTVDGMFGDTTLKYVKAFQTAQKIAVDGIVGNGTISKMKSATKTTLMSV